MSLSVSDDSQGSVPVASRLAGGVVCVWLMSVVVPVGLADDSMS